MDRRRTQNSLLNLPPNLTARYSTNVNAAAATTNASNIKNVMEYVNARQLEQADHDGRTHLFSKKNPNGIRVGHTLTVETISATGDKTPATFTGVCVAIRRNGISSSFTLRSVLLRVGIEQRFPIYSPLVKSIKVISTVPPKKK